jgi:putative phosphoribosyl transferase
MHADAAAEGCFADRREAGRRLAEALRPWRDQAPLLRALPRGGVPVAGEIAAALAAPLDVLLVRKLGAPGCPELALGAVVEGEPPQRVLNHDVVAALCPPAGYLAAEEARQLALIDERRRRWQALRSDEPVAGRLVIVVDDGIATGATMRAALLALQRAGARRCLVAVPVAAPSALLTLPVPARDIVCLLVPRHFRAVGAYYEDFAAVEDSEVVELLRRAREPGRPTV